MVDVAFTGQFPLHMMGLRAEYAEVPHGGDDAAGLPGNGAIDV